MAPKHVRRDDFFDIYPTVLRKQAEDQISSFTAVPDSFVPIIKLVLNEIDIDLIFVSIATLHTIPLNLELKDNKLLDSLDQPSIRAITGPVSEQLGLLDDSLTPANSVSQMKSSISCLSKRPSEQHSERSNYGLKDERSMQTY